jgi:1-acyl-sn-glycerol-3-phosphate acyltransferase
MNKRDMKLDDAILKLLRPLYKIGDPYVEGLEHLSPNEPALYVANHTTLGILDIPFFYIALKEQVDISLRVLAHRVFFKVPAWSRIMRSMGAVEGTRENCARLMAQREHVLVFPGGGGEVAKAKGQKYQLLWKDRIGFVKMAAAHGYPIIPFASVGAEECYDILLDRYDLAKSPIRPLLKYIPLKFEEIPPVVVGWGGTLLPKPERLYFKFLQPIQTKSVSPDDDEGCYKIRNEVKIAIESAISHLFEVRSRDPLRYHLASKIKIF